MKPLQLMAAGACLLALAACKTKEPEPAVASDTAPSSTPKSPAPDTDGKPAKPADTAPSASSASSDPANGDDYQIIHAKTKAGETDIAVKPPPGWMVATPPSSPDPHNGKFTIAEATKGIRGKGTLVASISTSLGELRCDLLEDQAPKTVANFVGLARGLRKFWDEQQRAWVGRPFYDGLTFHRVIPGFMIQGGDLAGTGAGRLWYQIPDEVPPGARHDRGGLLCMANRGPNTNEAQFFVTETAAPHLDGSYTIFGQCSPVDVVYRIARVPQSGPPDNRPLTPVKIEHVTFARIEGGTAARGLAEPSGALPDNKTPGVVPPGRIVRGDKPPE